MYSWYFNFISIHTSGLIMVLPHRIRINKLHFSLNSPNLKQ